MSGCARPAAAWLCLSWHGKVPERSWYLLLSAYEHMHVRHSVNAQKSYGSSHALQQATQARCEELVASTELAVTEAKFRAAKLCSMALHGMG